MKLLRFFIMLGLLAFCLTSPNGRAGENSGNHQSGIFGSVDGGLLTGSFPSEPIPWQIQAYSKNGKLVAETQTIPYAGENWHFELLLKPGHYTVVGNAFGFKTFPAEVIVRNKTFVEIGLVANIGLAR